MMSYLINIAVFVGTFTALICLMKVIHLLFYVVVARLNGLDAPFVLYDSLFLKTNVKIGKTRVFIAPDSLTAIVFSPSTPKSRTALSANAKLTGAATAATTVFGSILIEFFLELPLGAFFASLWMFVNIITGNYLLTTAKDQSFGSLFINEFFYWKKEIKINYEKLYEIMNDGLSERYPVENNIEYEDKGHSGNLIRAINFFQKITPEMRAELLDEFEAAASGTTTLDVLLLEQIVMHLLAHLPDQAPEKLVRITKRTLDLSPDCLTLRGSRGAALLANDRFDEALDMLANAEKEDVLDRCLNAYFRAAAYARSNRNNEAVAEYQRAIETKALLPTISTECAMIMGRIDRELSHLSRTIPLNA